MALYSFVMKALRPKTGPIAQMVGASALAQIAQLRSGAGISLPQVQAIVGEAIAALQDQVNAANNVQRMDGTVQVDGSALPFTPPGGSAGQLQANNGAGGFSAVTTSAQVAASISDETGSGPLVFATAPTLTGPIGIGTASPGSTLDVNGQIIIEQKNFGGQAGLLIQGGSPVSSYPVIGFSTLNTMTVDVIAAQLVGVIINNTSGSEAMDMAIVTALSGTLAEHVRITAAGKVGIGTATPTVSGTGNLLHVVGDTVRLFPTARTPANSADTGNDGEMCADSSYVYVHTGGSWRRAALSTF